MLIGDNEGDLMIFADAEEAESYIEAIDVKEGRWVLYDESGEVLALERTVDRLGREKVKAAKPGNSAGDPTRLRNALVSYLLRLGVQASGPFEKLSVPELVQLVRAEGYGEP